MLLAIDIGNTNIVFAAHSGQKFINSWRCSTDSSRSADEYAAILLQLLRYEGLDFNQISDVIISSVVPEASYHIKNFCMQFIGVEPYFIDKDSVSISIKLEKKEEVGSDRLVNAVAINAYYGSPAIVIDFGTATTFDMIDSSGAYIGGAIAPGPNISVDALHRAAAKLPKIDIRKPKQAIGRTTIEAMESGLYWGYIGMIEGLIHRLSSEMNDEPFILATGGLSNLFAQGTDRIDDIDENLTLKGLVHIYQHLQKAKAA